MKTTKQIVYWSWLKSWKNALNRSVMRLESMVTQFVTR